MSLSTVMFTKHGFMSRRTPTPLQFSTQHCSSYSTSTWTTVDASHTRRAPTATKRRPVRKKQPVSFCPVHSGRQAFSRCCLKSVSRGIRLALLLLLLLLRLFMLFAWHPGRLESH